MDKKEHLAPPASKHAAPALDPASTHASLVLGEPAPGAAMHPVCRCISSQCSSGRHPAPAQDAAHKFHCPDRRHVLSKSSPHPCSCTDLHMTVNTCTMKAGHVFMWRQSRWLLFAMHHTCMCEGCKRINDLCIFTKTMSFIQKKTVDVARKTRSKQWKV